MSTDFDLDLNGELGKDPNAVLETAMGKFETVLIMGEGKDGRFQALGTTTLSIADMNYMTDIFKAGILMGNYKNG